MNAEAGADLREQVRSRYAEAARAVLDRQGPAATVECCGTSAVLAEIFRVLVPGGRVGISDIVAEDHLPAADRAAAGSYAGCIAGALSRAEYLNGLTRWGFAGASVTFTAEAAPCIHSAIIRAVKPATP